VRSSPILMGAPWARVGNVVSAGEARAAPMPALTPRRVCTSLMSFFILRSCRFAQGQSCFVASLAPAARAWSFAQAICGCTRPPSPQSVEAMAFSRPTALAKRTMRSATNSGCSSTLVATLPSGSLAFCGAWRDQATDRRGFACPAPTAGWVAGTLFWLARPKAWPTWRVPVATRGPGLEILSY
jgi:hypothetical protein